MAETTTHRGGCHCGKVRFEVDAAIDHVLQCNCSICSKTESLLTFVPAEQRRLHAGAETLADYPFGKRSIHHRFCTTCGIRSFARGAMPDGREMAAVNVRCLDGIDLSALAVRAFGGRSL
jgi:hypothetical protein